MKFMFYFLMLLVCVFALMDCDAALARRGGLRRVRLGATAASSRAYPKPGTSYTEKWTWITTYTTNEQDQVTIISRGTATNGVTKAVCFKWNGADVPFAVRERFLSLSEEEKSNALGYTQEKWTSLPSTGETPTKPEDLSTDANLTKEIKTTELRW